ncbi:hypothetical protein [Phenylobacterium sp.]|uniref:hypothetical protein n=1 Tax=Phenylobacterium sp. TaxID=1871053 RepID=UPI0011F6CAE9|nr:hypothetical protein [Phenylobacterium sp.]THD61498.1 MAG: hypothetical protein E8A49_10985 [Phenylobacterium sp.]
MMVRATSLLAAAGAASGLAALWLATGASAGTIEVVSADADYARFHPKPAAAAPATGGDFSATLDRVFGPGRWRQTSGYRTVAQENALRRQGAGTVPAGHLSRHSIGDPDAPGAYDVVVAGMSPQSAAAKLRRDGAAFLRVAAEAAHGREGPHLHIELASVPDRGAAAAEN